MCGQLVNEEAARVVYKNNYSFGVKIFNIYMVSLHVFGLPFSNLTQYRPLVAPTGGTWVTWAAIHHTIMEPPSLKTGRFRARNTVNRNFKQAFLRSHLLI
jgi:hypothetical protein